MNGRGRSVATLALSFVVLALSVWPLFLGAEQDSLFVDPGRFETLAPLKAASGR